MRFAEAVDIYLQMYRLIELISNYTGAIILLRAVHDFILITSSAYNVCVLQIHGGDYIEAVARTRVIVLFLQHIIRPLLVCGSAEWTLDAASECVGALNSFAVRNPVDRQVMESFQYWSLHNRKPHFSATEFFDINTACLYAVSFCDFNFHHPDLVFFSVFVVADNGRRDYECFHSVSIPRARNCINNGVV